MADGKNHALPADVFPEEKFPGRRLYIFGGSQLALSIDRMAFRHLRQASPDHP